MYDTQLNRYIQFDAERQNDKDVRFCAIFMQFLFHGQEKKCTHVTKLKHDLKRLLWTKEL